jgi:hypothetical protein
MNFPKILQFLTQLGVATALPFFFLGTNGAWANDAQAIAETKFAETNKLGTLNQLDRIDIRQSQLGEEKETFQERLDKFALQLNQEEARAFSATTKLTGQVSFSLSNSFGR